MKRLLARAWPAAWPGVQFVGQLTDPDLLQQVDLLKGYLGALPHLSAFLGFAFFLIIGSLYLASYPAAAVSMDRLRKPLYWIVSVAFVVSFNLVLVHLPDTAFWSDLTPYRLSITLVAYLLSFWGLGFLLASSDLGAALRRVAPRE